MQIRFNGYTGTTLQAAWTRYREKPTVPNAEGLFDAANTVTNVISGKGIPIEPSDRKIVGLIGDYVHAVLQIAREGGKHAATNPQELLALRLTDGALGNARRGLESIPVQPATKQQAETPRINHSA